MLSRVVFLLVEGLMRPPRDTGSFPRKTDCVTAGDGEREKLESRGSLEVLNLRSSFA